MERLRDELAESYPNDKLLLTIHVVRDGKIHHGFVTKDFPNGDLLICVDHLEKEFVKVIKKVATGNGRM